MLQCTLAACMPMRYSFDTQPRLDFKHGLFIDERRLLDPQLNCVRVLQPLNEAWLRSDPYLVALLAKETTSA
eukprot:scaffold30166_cov18-Tisochrysis_lutea.AAC.1